MCMHEEPVPTPAEQCMSASTSLPQTPDATVVFSFPLSQHLSVTRLEGITDSFP